MIPISTPGVVLPLDPTIVSVFAFGLLCVVVDGSMLMFGSLWLLHLCLVLFCSFPKCCLVVVVVCSGF